MYSSDERRLVLDLRANQSNKERDSRHFQDLHFKASKCLWLTLTGIICPPVLCQIRLSFSLFSSLQVDQAGKTKHSSPIKSVNSAFHNDCPFSLSCRGTCTDLLLLVWVSKNTPAITKRNDGSIWAERSISAVITHKATDISCCRASWAARARAPETLL